MTISVEYKNSKEIKPYKGNARLHNNKQIQQLVKSIQNFGFINPIILDSNNEIIAGHGRYRAMQELGFEDIPCIHIDHLTKAQIRSYRIADNKLAENAGWDESLLRIELSSLQNININYDFSALGFETAEIDTLLNASTDELEDVQEEILPIAPDHPVTQVGDIYQCGLHRIGCGDARDVEFIRQVQADVEISLVTTDPPFNVAIEGHARGLGKHHHKNFVMASGEMSSTEYIQFLHTCLSNFSDVSRDGALHYIFIDWRHLYDLFQATEKIYSKLINVCVWNKISGGMGSFYRSQHELIGVYKSGTASHVNNIDLGKHGRYRTNVWNYPGLSSFSKDRDVELALHPTPKPIALIKDIILDASHRGDVVLDGFLGAGATLMACEQVHRKCIGIELDPKYVDVTLQRWMQYTGEEPIHIESGLTFTELTSKRTHKLEVA